MNYYEHHIGDYAEATSHLTFIEDAAYSRLIRKYYAQEKPLPADLKAVQRLVGARTKEEREAVDTVLNEFFQLDEDGWHNGRCDAEIARYMGKTDGREAKRANERERQRRHRERRKELFEQLRGHGIVPDFETSTDDLVTMLSRAQSQDVTQPVTRDATATQSPDTSHQTPDKGNSASTQPELRGESESASAAQLSGAMIRAGISAQSGDPRLMALAAQGVSVETVLSACREAQVSKPDEAIKPGYVFAILERWSADAAKLRANGAAPPRTTTRQAGQANIQRLNDRINGATHDDDHRIIDINDRPA
ncbi:YdaU family protein [Massilia sp. NP310]|uniref:YdaU family protein n=1 Tax=Massilia sp. NP310 TaxID=2861282 RepID=UPI001C63871A|nr:YdaU family protein [Massilia sp. NP310]QYG03875.1 YdaU family protein [Massilia sp. NP310]